MVGADQRRKNRSTLRSVTMASLLLVLPPDRLQRFPWLMPFHWTVYPFLINTKGWLLTHICYGTSRDQQNR